MFLSDDRMRDSKALSGRFRGEEKIKDPVEVIEMDANAIVNDL